MKSIHGIWLLLLLATACSKAPAESLTNLFCDCSQPDGGVMHGEYLGEGTSCVSQDDAEQACSNVVAQVSANANLGQCEVSSCTCSLRYEPDCSE